MRTPEQMIRAQHDPPPVRVEAPTPPLTAEPARSGGKAAAAAALVALLGAAAAVGGYALGMSGGQDLDGARAAGERQGQREGAEGGYDAGLRASFKRNYEKAYIRAYRAEFTKAGLPVPEKVDLPSSSVP